MIRGCRTKRARRTPSKQVPSAHHPSRLGLYPSLHKPVLGSLHPSPLPSEDWGKGDNSLTKQGCQETPVRSLSFSSKGMGGAAWNVKAHFPQGSKALGCMGAGN